MKWKTSLFFYVFEFSINAKNCTEYISAKFVGHVIEWSPSPNSLEVEHQSCKLEVLSSILSLGFTFFHFFDAARVSWTAERSMKKKTTPQLFALLQKAYICDRDRDLHYRQKHAVPVITEQKSKQWVPIIFPLNLVPPIRFQNPNPDHNPNPNPDPRTLTLHLTGGTKDCGRVRFRFPVEIIRNLVFPRGDRVLTPWGLKMYVRQYDQSVVYDRDT